MDKFLVTLEAIYYVILNFIRRPRQLEQHDKFAVFLKKSKKEFDKKTKKVTAEAFRPDQVKGRWETSLYRINDLSKDEVILLGNRWTVINFYPRNSGKSKVKAYGEILNKNVPTSLRAILEPSPHPGHVNLIDWSNEESEHETKMLELSIATNLIMDNE